MGKMQDYTNMNTTGDSNEEKTVQLFHFLQTRMLGRITSNLTAMRMLDVPDVSYTLTTIVINNI